MPKRNAKSDHMQRKSVARIGRVMEERTKKVLPVPRTPSKAEWERHVVCERRCHTDVGHEGSTNRNGLCILR